MRTMTLALCALSGLLVAAAAEAQDPRFVRLEQIAPQVQVLDAPAANDPRLSRIDVEVYGTDILGASDPLGIEFNLRAVAGPTYRVSGGHYGHWAILLIAARPANVMFPGYGMVLVDPNAIPFLLPFDANGNIAAPLEVWDASLLGVRFYSQAWEVPEIRPSPGLYLGIEHPNAQPMLTYQGPPYSGALCNAAMFGHQWYDVASSVLVPTSHHDFYVYSVEHAPDVSRVTMLLVTPAPGEVVDPVARVMNSVAFLGVPRPRIEVWVAKWQRNSQCIEVGLAAAFDRDF